MKQHAGESDFCSVRSGSYRRTPQPTWPAQNARIYEIRSQNLESLGFTSYTDYLGSELWTSIRKRVLDEKGLNCRCGNPATQIHHAQYDLEAMNGCDLSHLWPICAPCHRRAEYTRANRKRPPGDATASWMATSKKLKKRRGKRKRSGSSGSREFITLRLCMLGQHDEVREVYISGKRPDAESLSLLLGGVVLAIDEVSPER